jgi:hypothetical protein
MNYYIIQIDVKDGEHEYAYTHYTIAKTIEDAEKRAKFYLKDFFGNDTKETEYGWFYDADEERAARIGSVSEYKKGYLDLKTLNAAGITKI